MSYFYLKKYKRYKRHFICFNCKKGFRQPNEKDMAEQNGDLSLLLNAFYYSKPKKQVSKDIVEYLKEKYFFNAVKCPQCADYMCEVHMSFKTPPKKDSKQWDAMRSFYHATGYVYNDIPFRKKELITLFEESLEWHYKMEQNAGLHKSYGESQAEAKARIKQQAEHIKTELVKLKQVI